MKGSTKQQEKEKVAKDGEGPPGNISDKESKGKGREKTRYWQSEQEGVKWCFEEEISGKQEWRWKTKAVEATTFYSKR